MNKMFKSTVNVKAINGFNELVKTAVDITNANVRGKSREEIDQMLNCADKGKKGNYSAAELTMYGLIAFWTKTQVKRTVDEATAKAVLAEPLLARPLLEFAVAPYVNEVIYIDYENSPTFTKRLKSFGSFCTVIDVEGSGDNCPHRFNALTRCKNGVLSLESVPCGIDINGVMTVVTTNERILRLWNVFCEEMAQRLAAKNDNVDGSNV